MRLLIEDDNAKGLRTDLVDRLRKILTVLILVDDMHAFLAGASPGWRVHQLSGDRQGKWSISVSGNWRLTFDEERGHIDRLNLEDYH